MPSNRNSAEDPFRRLGGAFLAKHPEDAARALEQLSAEEVASFLETLPAREAAALTTHLSPGLAAHCLGACRPERMADILGEMSSRTAARVLRRLPGALHEAAFVAMGEAAARPLRNWLRYPENSIGARAEEQVLVLSPETTVGAALKRIRERSEMVEEHLHLVDPDGRFLGTVLLRDIAVARRGRPLKDFLRLPDVVLPARGAWHRVFGHVGWRNASTLPVLDRDGSFVGVIRRSRLSGTHEESPPSEGVGGPLPLMLALGELYTRILANAVRYAAAPGLADDPDSRKDR